VFALAQCRGFLLGELSRPELNHFRRKQASRRWKEGHAAQYAAYERDRVRRFKERFGEEAPILFLAYKEEQNRQRREWRANNRERYRKGHREGAKKRYWRDIETSRHKDCLYQHKRRHAVGWHSLEEWRGVCERQGHRCAMCHKECKLERDHIISVTKGGSNYISNIQGLCRSCNARKGNRS
jgi:hypothetical protein